MKEIKIFQRVHAMYNGELEEFIVYRVDATTIGVRLAHGNPFVNMTTLQKKDIITA